jgi:non-ribosomal peptide synthetase component F
MNNISAGYIGRPDLTEEKFIPNPCYDMMSASLPTKLQEHYRIVYRTGDLVRWRTDGNLEFLGKCT